MIQTDWPLIGNKHIVKFLQSVLHQGQAEGVFVFAGPAGLGKSLVAKYFSRLLLCQSGQTEACGRCDSCRAWSETGGQISFGAVHGDLHILEREEDKKQISIESARTFISQLSSSAFFGSHKIGIIREAETLGREAANALLKTLEEPRQKVVLILLVSDEFSLLDTILSRSRVLRFHPLPIGEVYDHLVAASCGRDEARYLAALSQGRPALALKLWRDHAFREDYEERLQILHGLADKKLFERAGALGKLLGESKAQAAKDRASAVLEAWTGLCRDYLLVESGRPVAAHWEKVDKSPFRMRKILACLRDTQQAGAYLAANANPQHVIEWLFCRV